MAKSVVDDQDLPATHSTGLPADSPPHPMQEAFVDHDAPECGTAVIGIAPRAERGIP